MVEQQLISIIKCVLTNEYKVVKVDDWNKLLTLAKVQGVVPCVAFYVEKLSDNDKPNEKVINFLKNFLFQSAVVSENQLQAVEEMQNELEKAKIYSVKLKGSCTKLRYSNDVIRTMGDIDILYKPEQHKEFRNVLENQLNYGDFREGRKNDTYSRKPNLCVEAHRELVAADSYFADYYRTVWDRCVLVNGYKYRYQMTLEDEYVFNIIHLMEHFRHGGIGIRFIMDIFVYENLTMDFEYVNKILKDFGIFDFYKNIQKLSKVWFGNDESNEIVDELAEYILTSGIFGSAENADDIAIGNGGKFKFIMKVCFPSYDDMASMFPWLKGKKILLPVAWMVRAFRSVFKRKKNVKEQLQTLKKGDSEKGQQIKEFYGKCGFPDKLF